MHTELSLESEHKVPPFARMISLASPMKQLRIWQFFPLKTLEFNIGKILLVFVHPYLKPTRTQASDAFAGFIKITDETG